MKNIFTWIILIILPVFCFGEPNYFLPGGNQPDDNTVIAKVGKNQILLNDFINRYTSYLAAAGIKDYSYIRKSVLTNMINEIILKNYDNNKNIFNDNDYKQEIAWAKKQAVLGFLKDREIYARITVTDDELRQTFEKVNEKIAARHLFAPSEDQANFLYEQLMKGAGFDSLAKQVFVDSTLKNNGGYLGYFSWGDMDPDFENAAFSLKIGEISKPVKTVYGWSIIKLEDRISNPVITENEYLNKKNHIERTLKIKKKIPSERAYINRVFDQSKIKFNDNAVNSLLDALLASDAKSMEIKNRGESGFPDCAEYEGVKYSSSDISRQINQVPFFLREKIKNLNDLKDVIVGLMLQEKLLKIAASKAYDKNPQVLEMFNKLSDMIFLKYKRREILNNASIPDSEVIKFYSSNIKQFTLPDELNIQEIIVKGSDLADSLKEKLLKGEDFGLLAKKYSIRTWSSENNGLMGFAPAEKYGMLGQKFWNAPLNELLGPIKIENYYGLFLVLGKKKGKALDFSLAKNEAAGLAKKQMSAKLTEDYLDVLKKKIPIDIKEDLLFSYKLDPVYSQ